MNINAKIIAKILINKCHELGREITNLKLQKLLYFAQGHYTQEHNGSFLFEDDFEAWAHGPVVPNVYGNYKGYSWYNLPNQSIDFDVDSNINNFLDKLLKYYGASDGKELEIVSHDEQPWRNARGTLNDYMPSTNKITKISISNYYKEKDTLNGLIRL